MAPVEKAHGDASLPRRPGPPTRGALPTTVLALGVVSFFNDLSSEMIYPLLPLFLTSVLAASRIVSFPSEVEDRTMAVPGASSCCSGDLSRQIVQVSERDEGAEGSSGFPAVFFQERCGFRVTFRAGMEPSFSALRAKPVFLQER